MEKLFVRLTLLLTLALSVHFAFGTIKVNASRGLSQSQPRPKPPIAPPTAPPDSGAPIPCYPNCPPSGPG
jgi:hypothetical protein